MEEKGRWCLAPWFLCPYTPFLSSAERHWEADHSPAPKKIVSCIHPQSSWKGALWPSSVSFHWTDQNRMFRPPILDERYGLSTFAYWNPNAPGNGIWRQEPLKGNEVMRVDISWWDWSSYKSPWWDWSSLRSVSCEETVKIQPSANQEVSSHQSHLELSSPELLVEPPSIFVLAVWTKKWVYPCHLPSISLGGKSLLTTWDKNMVGPFGLVWNEPRWRLELRAPSAA